MTWWTFSATIISALLLTHPLTETFMALGGVLRAAQTKLGVFGIEVAMLVTLAAMMHTFSDDALGIAPW